MKTIKGASPLETAARRLNISSKTLSRWAREKKVRSIATATGRIFIPEAEIQRLMPVETAP